MDSIVGIPNFRNEIVWERTSTHSCESQLQNDPIVNTLLKDPSS
jgi:adenine specific DNA methylase Mod